MYPLAFLLFCNQYIPRCVVSTLFIAFVQNSTVVLQMCLPFLLRRNSFVRSLALNRTSQCESFFFSFKYNFIFSLSLCGSELQFSESKQYFLFSLRFKPGSLCEAPWRLFVVFVFRIGCQTRLNKQVVSAEFVDYRCYLLPRDSGMMVPALYRRLERDRLLEPFWVPGISQGLSLYLSSHLRIPICCAVNVNAIVVCRPDEFVYNMAL